MNSRWDLHDWRVTPRLSDCHMMIFGHGHGSSTNFNVTKNSLTKGSLISISFWNHPKPSGQMIVHELLMRLPWSAGGSEAVGLRYDIFLDMAMVRQVAYLTWRIKKIEHVFRQKQLVLFYVHMCRNYCKNTITKVTHHNRVYTRTAQKEEGTNRLWSRYQWFQQGVEEARLTLQEGQIILFAALAAMLHSVVASQKDSVCTLDYFS